MFELAIYLILKMSFDEKLIDEVEKFELLYNKKLKTYRNSSLREKAWKEISEKLNADVETCKARWKNLRDTFCKKNRNLPSGSAAEIDEKMEWIHFKRLLFLKEFVSPRKTASNFDQWTLKNIIDECTPSPPVMESTTINELEKDIDVSLDLQNMTQATDLPSTSTSTPLNKKKKRAPDGTEESLSKFLKTMGELAQTRFGENDTNDDGFSKLLISKLERLPERIKEETKMEILNLVHNKEMEHRFD